MFKASGAHLNASRSLGKSKTILSSAHACRDAFKGMARCRSRSSLAQKDLVSEFGSESRVSEFLNGKRDLSKEQAISLAKRFSLRLEALLL